jgi:selenocysteine lyase/cysteine desulfurase
LAPDVERWRSDTPGVAAGRIHLNNAGASLMPRAVLETIRAHLELEARIGGYEAADAAEAEIAAAYGSVARLVGGAPRNIAMVENATVAFFQALAAFDFARGDVILTTRNDYISNQLAYLSLQRRAGVRVVRAADLPEGGVDPESVRALIRRERPKLVTLTWVPTNSGLVQPAEAVGAVCEEEGVLYVVDACQAVGQLPIDVRELRCDFLSATARKFLRGPRGAGFLWVSDRALDRGAYPLLVDMRGAEWVEADEFRLAPDARRFENWEFAYALVLGQGAAARYALDAVGIERGGERAARLAAYARDRLREHDGLRVLDRGPRLCAIVTVEVAGRSAFELVPRLREQGINTSATARDYAVLDMDEKRARTALRISPHYYNTEAEVDAAVAAIAALAGSAAS